MEIICIALALLLAAANGANDNGKGIATLAGAGVTSYRKALWWAHCSTLAGALLSGFLASRMLKLFSSGIVSAKPTPEFTIAVLLGAAGWVLIATATKLPVSTTHAIVGALIGAGFIFAPGSVQASVLLWRVALPLLLSIGVSYTLSATLNYLLSAAPECTCVRLTALEASGVHIPQLTVVQADAAECRAHNNFLALNINSLHWLSSGLVGAARGLNDAPKVTAIALAVVGAAGVAPGGLLVLLSLAMFAGGVAGGARVARRMGNDVIKMSHREGAFANVVTSTLIILGACLGWPMSTTHVSTGAIVGVARGNVGKLNRKTLRDFLLAWTVTPVTAALIGATVYYVMTRF
ncbi:MAG: inorganic phosphate transporter [Pyrinomonadaceae bacterium]